MLSGLFKTWDLTRKWKPQDPAVVLAVDLDHHRLCGVGLGDPFERMESLGKPDASFPTYDQGKKHIVGSSYFWLPWGLTLWVSGDTLESWDMDLSPDLETPRPPKFQYRNQPFALAGMTHEQVVETFGPPTFDSRDAHKEDSSPHQGYGITYDFPDRRIEWYFDMSEDGKVEGLTMDPLEEAL